MSARLSDDLQDHQSGVEELAGKVAMTCRNSQAGRNVLIQKFT